MVLRSIAQPPISFRVERSHYREQSVRRFPRREHDTQAAVSGQIGRAIHRRLLSFLQKRKSITLDALTQREQVVLSVIGDGSDNKQASDRLGISRYTVATHRESIMRKLSLHHVGQLMLYALQHGYVHVTAKGVYYPGFQRRLGCRIGTPAVRGTAEKGGPKPAMLGIRKEASV
jgi:DNA-binding CsgD family transcriptional regulator